MTRVVRHTTSAVLTLSVVDAIYMVDRYRPPDWLVLAKLIEQLRGNVATNIDTLSANCVNRHTGNRQHQQYSARPYLSPILTYYALLL